MLTDEREKFISENLGLVHSLANKFRNRGIEYDDLYSAGCLGLVKAVDGFNGELGFKFSTYAVPVILGEIKRLFRESGAVKVSRAMKEKARLAQKQRERLEADLNREPTVNELAAALGISEFETAELLNISTPPLSLTGDGGEDTHGFDIPVDSGEDAIQNSIAIKEILLTLDERDRRLIELRYFSGCTQAVTAEKLGLTQVQVSRRERSLLLDMRSKMTG
ncbi:MAG: sigma-70 family RNA polymerase sigma factor [Clostridia bacterium]|nr:sigma-70 family RNA polymerase sigma factor [Clostridia bacterium]